MHNKEKKRKSIATANSDFEEEKTIVPSLNSKFENEKKESEKSKKKRFLHQCIGPDAAHTHTGSNIYRNKTRTS